jgi:hypothetical protein
VGGRNTLFAKARSRELRPLCGISVGGGIRALNSAVVQVFEAEWTLNGMAKGSSLVSLLPGDLKLHIWISFDMEGV